MKKFNIYLYQLIKKMISLKRQLKNIFKRLNALYILDKILYIFSHLSYFTKNYKYKKINPNFSFPPDYFLYETYKLDYKQYKEDGELAAKEILEWTSKYILGEFKILEWGCGVGRVIRHFPQLVNKEAVIVGADINSDMIKWDLKNIENVNFETIDYLPPTSFENNQFNIVFALSVFTHIENELQEKWFTEIKRIITENGIFLFSTHGKKFEINLDENEKKILTSQGSLTFNYKQKGHRMMSTYNKYENLKIIIQKHFEILEFYSGDKYPEKIGGQDLWIVRKRN